MVTQSAEKIVRVVKNWKNVGQSHPGFVTRPCTNIASSTSTTATPTHRHGCRRPTTGISASFGTAASGGSAACGADVTEVVDTGSPWRWAGFAERSYQAGAGTARQTSPRQGRRT